MTPKNNAACIGLCIALAASCGCSRNALPPEAPPVVMVSAPLQQQVTEWDEYVGRFEAVESVDVRPRVSGMLRSVEFRDGQTVAKGQVLFTLDPRPIAAQLEQSRAQLLRAKATLVNADAQLRRGRALIASHTISQSDFDTLSAAEQQAGADVAAAQANVDASALNLEFTRVVAPLTGKISYHRLAPGNLVTAESTVLTTIVTLNPIRFVFDAPESALLKYKREAGGALIGNRVDIRLQDETDYRWSGHMEFLDNALDNASGTIRGRALVENPAGFLTPGMFGHLRVFAARPTAAMLIPDQAVVNDQTRQIAYVVGTDGTVAQRTLEVGQLIHGLREIRGGLAATDRVIIDGVQRAHPGRKVDAKPGRMSAFPSGVSVGENGQLKLP
ncbi:MAG TPA: efflux RND transporter periplasmic adaptor subunit [Steroidobacteraceae bacterium]|nr:efflux RND transporter periplasmic adaptor subunit [Steroidobacteraceae bacterium]